MREPQECSGGVPTKEGEVNVFFFQYMISCVLNMVSFYSFGNYP